MLDGIAVLIWFLQALLLPDYPAIRYPGLAVSFVAEVGLALWLLVKGVKSSTRSRLAGARSGTRSGGRRGSAMRAVVCTPRLSCWPLTDPGFLRLYLARSDWMCSRGRAGYVWSLGRTLPSLT